jgi:hypothetical protein
MTLLSAACHNWSGFTATRWFLGMSVSSFVIDVVMVPDFTLKDGPFLPLVVHYLTTSYRRGELGRQLATILCRLQHRERLLGFALVWSIPDNHRQPKRLAVPLYHRRRSDSCVFRLLLVR